MKALFNILILCFLPLAIFAQEENEEFRPYGNAFGRVYWNYHYDASPNTDKKNSFELTRSYVGYNYYLSPELSINITLDGEKSSNASDFTFFLKKAHISYNILPSIKLQMGMIGLKQFDTQEKFWGYRYMFKALEDEFKYGSSADLGFNAEVKLTNKLTANVFLLNGEGYTSKQDNNGRLKFGGNLLYRPIDELIIKVYGDYYGGNVSVNDSVVITDTVGIKTFNVFAGYKTDKFRIGAGLAVQKDGAKYNTIAADHDLFGWSVMGTYVINDHFELFGYILSSESNILEGEEMGWNYENDSEVYLGGVQYAPVKGLKMSLNARFWDNKYLDNESLLYFSCEFSF